MKPKGDSSALFKRVGDLEKRTQSQQAGPYQAAVTLVCMVVAAFMVLWVAAAGWAVFRAIREMARTGQPLVIKGRQLTWVASVGFVALLVAIGLAGLACLGFVLRLVRKGLPALWRGLAKEPRGDS